MRGLIVGSLTASALLLACAPRTPYQARSDYQRRQAAAIAAPELGAEETWGAFQRLPVRVYATQAYARADAGWRGNFEEQLEFGGLAVSQGARAPLLAREGAHRVHRGAVAARVEVSAAQRRRRRRRRPSSESASAK